jgi:hypothetical protein
MRLHDSWQFWALLSAGFAALTAVFAKIGIDSINSDFATFVRTIVILIVAGGIVLVTGGWQDSGAISIRSWIFLILSGLATGFSWLCYFRALRFDLGGLGLDQFDDVVDHLRRSTVCGPACPPDRPCPSPPRRR